MNEATYNGFTLKYGGYTFPPNESNAITYECFCLMGGLANERLHKVQHRNGSHTYVTYHRIDVR